ncbi:MAG TPA: Flp pilus assembly protein CpaB [Ruminococcaceae bacterium]|jgi:pilus assembly protein CpaB|nr:Flp pilus assembly protein CpaB [Oscillospiraceae bacterium]
MKKLFRNRTFLGSIAIIAALIICFVAAPAVNSAAGKETAIVRVTKNIPKGTQITEEMFQTVKVGAYNLPQNVVTSSADTVGKYTTAALQPGDYILTTKLSSKAPDIGLSSLDGTKQAVSISIKDFADGVSGKLETGDVISLYVAGYDDMDETISPPELQYVKLLAATTDKGVDSTNKSSKSSDNSDDDMPSTLTVLVTPEQAVKLVDYEHNGTLHAALVYRGAEANANKFLKMEDEYMSTQIDTAGGTKNGK